MHLSAPEGSSINDYIDPEAVAISYTTIDDAIHIVNMLRQGTLLAKNDLKRAFSSALLGQRTGISLVSTGRASSIMTNAYCSGYACPHSRLIALS